MIDGHGDDIYLYGNDIRANFSSNVYNHFSHDGLFSYLSGQMSVVAHYPQPAPRRLEACLARRLHVGADELLVTAGATEAIYLTALAMRGCRSAIVVPAFAEYADACQLHSHQIVCIRTLEKMPSETEVMWICNPNNPTGQVHGREKLLDFMLRHPDVLFVVDASYASFTRIPLVTPEEACRLPNVVVLHSMTKEFAIPGLRLGFLTSSSSLVARIGKGRMPWSVNGLAQEAGLWLVSHAEEYRLPLDVLLEERRRVSIRLSQTGLCEPLPSDTHILLCCLRIGTAADLKSYLVREHGILIRDASNFAGLDGRFFRIAVQTPEENDALIDGIECFANYLKRGKD